MRWPLALVSIQALDSSRGLLLRARGPTVALTIEGAGPAQCKKLELDFPWADAVSCGKKGVVVGTADLNVRVLYDAVEHDPAWVSAPWTQQLHALPTQRLYAGVLARSPAPLALPDALRAHPLFELPFAHSVRVVSRDVQELLAAPHVEVWRGDRMDALLCARQGITAQPLPGTGDPVYIPSEAVPGDSVVNALAADLALPGSLGFARNTDPWWQRAQKHGGKRGYGLSDEPDAPKDLFWWQLMDGEYMLPGATCGSFGYSVRSGGSAHHNVQECSPYLLDTLNAYRWAKRLTTEQEVNYTEFEFLNAILNQDKHDKKDKEVIQKAEAEVIKELFCNEFQQGQYTGSEDAARLDPAVEQLKYGCGPGGAWRTPTPENPNKETWCLAPKDKVKLMSKYLADYYGLVRTLPEPAARTEVQWDAWLDACATLLTRLHMIHPFRGANSRTRVILLDVLLAQQGVHPVLVWNFKVISPVAKTIKDGLAAWEASVATGENAWRFLAHVRKGETELRGKLDGTGPAALEGKVLAHVRSETELPGTVNGTGPAAIARA